MADIPVVDISSSRPASQVARELVDAAVEHGFVFIKSRGLNIAGDNIDELFETAGRFFATSLDDKTPYKIGENNYGWSGMHVESLGGEENQLGDFKEAFNIGEFINDQPAQPLPPILEEHVDQLRDFSRLCHGLCMRILDLFAIGLEIQPTTWFSDRHRGGKSGTILRLLYYPPVNASSGADPTTTINSKHRAGAHSDYGSVTLLFQRPTQPGLEVLSPVTKTWTAVPVSPPSTEHDAAPPILVNIGDLLCHWTRGLFRSTVHRVAFPAGAAPARYSIAYFCHPLDSTRLEPVPSRRVQKYEVDGDVGGVGIGGETITAHEHLMRRLRATYKGVYEDAA